MDHERAADILEEMEPSAAADALEDLDEELAERILAHMEPEEAADVQELLAYDEDSAGRIMTTEFVRVTRYDSVGDVLAQLRAMEEPPDPLLAVYVMDEADPERLAGLVRVRTLLTADTRTPVAELIEDDLQTVCPDDPAEHAARVLAEYNLLAVPVLDDSEHMIGVVTVDDALAVLLPEIWQRRGKSVFR